MYYVVRKVPFYVLRTLRTVGTYYWYVRTYRIVPADVYIAKAPGEPANSSGGGEASGQ